MIRVLAVVCAFVWAGSALAETLYSDEQVVQMSTVELSERPEALVRALERMLPPENAPLAIGDGAFAVSYAGFNPPQQFTRFLKTRFPDIEPSAFRNGFPTNVSLVISEATDGSSVQLVMLLPKTKAMQADAKQFHQQLFGRELPASAKIYVNTAPTSDGPSNIVLSLGTPRADATDEYALWLEDEGFEVERSDQGDNNLILAQRDRLVAYLFFQDDPDRKGGSIMVLQHLEE